MDRRFLPKSSKVKTLMTFNTTARSHDLTPRCPARGLIEVQAAAAAAAAAPARLRALGSEANHVPESRALSRLRASREALSPPTQSSLYTLAGRKLTKVARSWRERCGCPRVTPASPPAILYEEEGNSPGICLTVRRLPSAGKRGEGRRREGGLKRGLRKEDDPCSRNLTACIPFCLGLHSTCQQAD